MSENEHFSIRGAGVEDVSGLVPLYVDFLRSYNHSADAKQISDFLHRIFTEPGVVFFLAEDSRSRIVGFAACILSYSSVSQAFALNINDMFVEAACRRRGVATALCDVIEAYAGTNRFVKLFLAADPGAEPAMKLYLKAGFTVEPFVSMMKKLSE